MQIVFRASLIRLTEQENRDPWKENVGNLIKITSHNKTMEKLQTIEGNFTLIAHRFYQPKHLMFIMKWTNLHPKKSWKIRSLKGQHNAEQEAAYLREELAKKSRKDDIIVKNKIRPFIWRVIKLEYNSWYFQRWETEFTPSRLSYPLYQRHVRREVKIPAFRFHMSVSSSLL